ncbi:hypothetical protein BASA81_003541 [Batrachochytrium salamandrivorans]|nr:hypothetical protein BASA81_003541 [Batrachochytrium salamandrivorans]
MASRYVLDLRKPAPPPPVETDAERCASLQLEVYELKQTQKILLAQLTSLSPSSSTASTNQDSQKLALVQRELQELKSSFAKLTEDHDIALKLIVQLGKATTSPQAKQNKRPNNKLPGAHRDRIGEYFKALDLPSHHVPSTSQQ